MISFIKQLFSKKETVDEAMKYLIVGLGNMGAEYDDTRHNVGFDVVDHLARDKETKWKHETLGDLAMIKHKGRHIYLLKPSTFMNRSGKAVRYWMQKLKIQPDNVLIVVDELNLKLNQIRLRGKGSDGGHNGLKDITAVLGRSNYPRLRIGIGKDFHKGEQINFVLGKWTAEERKVLAEIIPAAGDACLGYTTLGLSRAMNSFNK